MGSDNFFKQKPEPTMFDEDPKSIDEYDREMLCQLCYDIGVDDEDIDELVQSLIDWKNKRSDLYKNN